MKIEKQGKAFVKFMEEFKKFALRGNVMDMAVGVIIGGAFSGIVTSLTENFINPILNELTGAASYTWQALPPRFSPPWSISLSWRSSFSA